MKTIRDLSGKRFGRLRVLLYEKTTHTPNGTSVIWWICKCECGNTVRVRGSNLRTGNTTSCGCYQAEIEKIAGRTHGMTGTSTYQSWRAMRERCLNPNNSHYKYYGGRGIKFCPAWNSFSQFLIDMGERPANRTLDRIDNNGHYEPSNCRWATDSEQRSNKRKRNVSVIHLSNAL